MQTPEGTVVQVQLAFGLMMKVVPQVIPVAVVAGLDDEEGSSCWRWLMWD